MKLNYLDEYLVKYFILFIRMYLFILGNFMCIFLKIFIKNIMYVYVCFFLFELMLIK